MPQTEHYEVLIVGGGKAGKTLAVDLAKFGVRVCLVERGQIGGTCINTGCIPSKAIIRCAEIAANVVNAARFGTDVERTGTRMSGVLAYKRAVVAGMVELNWKNLHGTLGDRYVLGQATFVDPKTIDVVPAAGGAVRRMSGDKVFINVGSKPAMPTVPGLDEAAPLTSTSLMELDYLPDHLVILGGGSIAVEFGQAFRRLGSRVTLIQRAARLLSAEEPETSEAVETLFAEDGIDVFVHARAPAVEGKSGESVKITFTTPNGHHTVVGSHLLIATGRVPATDGLNLAAAGVDVDASDAIVVNDRLETSAADVWALGDCAGSPQHTHVALDDYRIVKANVFAGGERSTLDRLIPHTVFIDPELGRVGMTEPQARERGLDIRVARAAMSAVPKARTLGSTHGFMKAVVDAPSKRILGFTMLGPHAGEVTAVVQTAMWGGLPFTALRDGVIAHPTMAEGLNVLFASITV